MGRGLVCGEEGMEEALAAHQSGTKFSDEA